jgi:iron complex outermembrane receptor protein
MKTSRPAAGILPITILAALASSAIAQSLQPGSLANASLEDLMKIDVTSVSKKEQSISKTPAAVFVINREAIRRSGAANIPDILRMAPGVEVAQLNANEWGISIRGFNSVFSNKVLVLIDGRTVYSDAFSGVYWDQIDVPLEDIERIEVIRGPGGTVWGANAVNGVINIITSSAADTKGGLAVAGSGPRQTAAGLVQYGGDAGSRGAYRIFGKYFNDTNSPMPGGRTAPDGWHSSHAGFRGDWALTTADTLSVQGDFLSGSGGETFPSIGPSLTYTWVNAALNDRSGDGLLRWDHTLSNGSQTSLQISESVVNRDQVGVKLSDKVFDVDFQHHLAAGTRHDLVWGFDYRSIHIGLYPERSYGLHTDPPFKINSLFAAFVQDEIRLTSALFLTVGSKVEHNAYTGLQFEPSAQLVWLAGSRQSFWASASHSIREPDSIEHGISLPLGVTPVSGGENAEVLLQGNPTLEAERMNDFEVGYRTQLGARISMDATGFLSYYSQMVTTEPDSPYLSSGAAPTLILPITFRNLAHARDYGFEIFGNWQATTRWKLSPGYSALRMKVAQDPGGQDAAILTVPGDSPRQQFEFRSQFNVRRNLEWDSSLKYVDQLKAFSIPAYVRVDSRIGWRFGESTELSVVGQNLTSHRRFEFADVSGLFSPSQVSRTIFGKLTWRF